MLRNSFQVEVNPAVLRWARETAGRTVAHAASSLQTTEYVISQWESGQKAPDWRSLGRLAAYYQRPIGALLLHEPPIKQELLPDFRTIPDSKRDLSPKTLLAIRTARWLQRHAIDIRRDVGFEVTPDRARLRIGGDIERLASECRATLGVDFSEQSSWRNSNDAYRRWKEALGQQGVLVFQFPFPRDESQGFSLFDELCPVIVINESDWINARIFTLFHEYCHLLLREPGICLPMAVTQSARTNTETFCNSFAAAVLIPASEARSWKISAVQSAPTFDALLKNLAEHCKVSRFVALLRLKTINAITPELFQQALIRLKGQLEVHRVSPKKPKQGGPSAAQRSVRQRGKTFVSLVFDAKKRGVITTHDAVTYLGVKLQDLRKIESKL